MPELEGKKPALLFLSEDKKEGIKWQLKICSVSTIQRMSGYQDLCYHIDKRHRDLIPQSASTARRRRLEIETTFTYPRKTQFVNAWLEMVMITMQPF